MRNCSKTALLTIAFLLALVCACVTINIYFPAEKVESVAQEIVEEIRKDEGNDAGTSSHLHSPSFPNTLLAFIAPAAWAQEVTTVSNATIRALKESMKRRFADMKHYFRDGVLVEGSDGYVAVGNTEGLGLKEKRALRGLMEAENSDRERLYAEVARALNIDSEQVGRVAEIFAQEWMKSLQ